MKKSGSIMFVQSTRIAWVRRQDGTVVAGRGRSSALEDAWARYCQPEGDTPTRSNNIKSLRGRWTDTRLERRRARAMRLGKVATR